MKIMRTFVIVNVAAACILFVFYTLTWNDHDGTRDYTVRTNRKSLHGYKKTSHSKTSKPISSDTSTPGEENCYPWKKIVFIKTHKTASTTSNTIIQRYGYLHNLTFVLPRQGWIFSETQLFSRRQVFRSERWTRGNEARPDFDIMAGHFRYNRPEVEKVLPRAMHITILRNPVDRFESTFGYYDMASRLNLQNAPNPLDTFMKRPMYYLKLPDFNFRMKVQLRNGLMYSLGFPFYNFDSDDMIKRKIEELDRQLDFVMLTEYYDESLILLKDLLCWDFDDILYIPKGLRSDKRRNPIFPELAERIRAWNKADMMLYEHFNDSFWRQIEDYGPKFYDDLEYFRKRQKEFVDECIDPDKVKTVMGKEDALVLRPNASEFCHVSYFRVFTFVTDSKLKQSGKKHLKYQKLDSKDIENLGMGRHFYEADVRSRKDNSQ